MPLSMLFGILAFMLILSAFFAGSETSLMSLNRYRLRYLVKLKHPGAIKTHKLLQRPDRFLENKGVRSCNHTLSQVGRAQAFAFRARHFRVRMHEWH